MRDLVIARMYLDMYANIQENCGTIRYLRHPEYILRPNIMHKFVIPECDTAHEYEHKYIAIVAKTILTNIDHTGIWLIIEDSKDKVSIPGGHIAEQDWDRHVDDPNNIVSETIARELCEETELYEYNESWIQYQYNGVLSKIQLFLNECGFTAVSVYYEMYYDYLSAYNTMIFYRVIEVNEPDSFDPNVSAFMGNGRFVWYAKKDHFNNTNTYYKNGTLPDFGFGDDIRTTKRGIETLNRIFTEESLFGKPNVY